MLLISICNETNTDPQMQSHLEQQHGERANTIDADGQIKIVNDAQRLAAHL